MKSIKKAFPKRSCRDRAIMLGVLLTAASADAQVLSLRPTAPMETATMLKVKQLYTSQLGVREQKANAGPRVNEYLRYVGLPKGNPWCAAFVCWALGKAGVENPKSGWSPDLFPASKIIWSRAESLKRKAESAVLTPNPSSLSPGTRPLTPQSADVFGIYFAEKGRIAHCGFVDSWDGTWMVTVEGNTNVSGSREGDGVYRKRRMVSTVYKVARFID